MMAIYLTLLAFTALVATSGIQSTEIFATQGEIMTSKNAEAPKVLFKVLTEKHWADSQKNKVLTLSEMDNDFIHLAKEEQLQRIIDKFWGSIPKFIVLKLQTDKLQGEMVYEVNPGGESKYYHLYNGEIPLSAIMDVTIIDRSK